MDATITLDVTNTMNHKIKKHWLAQAGFEPTASVLEPDAFGQAKTLA